VLYTKDTNNETLCVKRKDKDGTELTIEQGQKDGCRETKDMNGSICKKCKWGFKASEPPAGTSESDKYKTGTLCTKDAPFINPQAKIIVKQLGINTYTVSVTTLKDYPTEAAYDCSFKYTYPIKSYMTDLIQPSACLLQGSIAGSTDDDESFNTHDVDKDL